MGMDIYLFEVLDDEKSENIEEVDFFEDEFEEVPNEIKEKAYWKDYELIDVEKIVKDHGKKLEDIAWEEFSEKGYRIGFKDGGAIELLWEEIDKKYTIIEKRPTIKVRELAYRRYGYFCGHFKIHPLSNDDEAEKHGLKRFYFDPKEMYPVLEIFKVGDRWKEIIEEFEKAKRDGKLCFVYVSY